ncbi:unnamed protein product, partial [Meganyctiphanes norvegica]
DGASSGFHEAIGDTIQLVAMNPASLHHRGLHYEQDVQRDGKLIYLLKVALHKLPLLTFAQALVKWHTAIMKGLISESLYNKSWWDMRHLYQGIKPPRPRSSHHLDPLSKYHVATNMPYA